MSFIDFTASLFRDQRLADAFSDNPVQALLDAGLPDVTPADVQALLPTVAESMPPDHPLQSLVRPAETSPIVEPQPDGSVTDVGIDTTIVHEDEGYDVGGSDPRVTTTAEDLGQGLDPRVTTTAEDLGGGSDPRVTTTAEDLGSADTGWTPYEEAMDWTIQPAVLPTTSPEPATETLPEPAIDDPNLVICPLEEPVSYEQYEQSDTYSADQSSYESTSATESSAGSEYIG
jgi:hypothetical protein